MKQSTLIVLAIALGAALTAILVVPRTLGSILVGASLSGWLAAGVGALLRAELQLRGRRGGKLVYSGTYARFLGLFIVAASLMVAWFAWSMRNI